MIHANYKILKHCSFTGLLLLMLSCSQQEMIEPNLSEIEYEFFRRIMKEYDCQIKRTHTSTSVESENSVYRVQLIYFPDTCEINVALWGLRFLAMVSALVI